MERHDISKITEATEPENDANAVPRKKTRKFHRKVKTGCITCKIRKVRCDEQKPACQRCISTGRTCDGYGYTGQTSSRDNEPSSSHTKILFPIPYGQNTSRGAGLVKLAPNYSIGPDLNVNPVASGTPYLAGFPDVPSIPEHYLNPGIFTPFEWGFDVRSREIPRSPSSNTTAEKLSAILDVSDPRYSLGCYGGFLKYVLQRLGRSRALDTAVNALISAYPYHYTRQRSKEAMVRYTCALYALRTSLSGSSSDQTVETWAAVYIIMICQGWIGQSDDHIRTHGEMLSRMAGSALQRYHNDDPLEAHLLQSLYVPLILESMINPRLSLEAWEGHVKSPISRPKASIPMSSIEAPLLLQMPVFFYRPLDYFPVIESTYHEMCINQHDLSQYLENLESIVDRMPKAFDPIHHHQTKLHHSVQIVHAVLLTIVIALNSLLRAFHPDSSLLEDTVYLCDEFIRLGHSAARYRPLGASYIPPCAAAIWATTTGLISQQAQLENLMLKYQPDFPQMGWLNHAHWLKSSHGRLKSTLDKSITDTSQSPPIEVGEMSMVHCKGAFGAAGPHLLPLNLLQ